MTEFITRGCHAEHRYEVIIKTDSEEHYCAAQAYARLLIGHQKPMTNADRIRAMSDEELLNILSAPCPFLSRVDDKGCPNPKPCRECIAERLKQPAEEKA